MKTLLTICGIFVCVLGFGINVSAFQEVSAIVTNSYMDQGRQTCTIFIDRGHYKTNQTARCRDRAFSWRCLYNDYRFELAGQSRKNRRPILIRYSEYSCDEFTANMLLLTVW